MLVSKRRRIRRSKMSKSVVAVITLVFLSACVVVHERNVPPGQIKKQMAPGQMKK